MTSFSFCTLRRENFKKIDKWVIFPFQSYKNRIQTSKIIMFLFSREWENTVKHDKIHHVKNILMQVDFLWVEKKTN